MTTLQARIQALRKNLAGIAAELEELMAWDEAISLAYTERTGRQLQRDQKYTAEDAARAEEIMRLFPGSDA